jgi:hypothetical protein
LSSRQAPLLALVLTALITGCGGGTGVGGTDSERDGVVEIALTDFRLKPQVIRAPRDSLTVLVRNEGRLAHALRIRGASEVVRLKVSTLLPGEEAARVGVKLKRGHWRLYCPLANHEELGMHGTLEIR